MFVATTAKSRTELRRKGIFPRVPPSVAILRSYRAERICFRSQAIDISFLRDKTASLRLINGPIAR